MSECGETDPKSFNLYIYTSLICIPVNNIHHCITSITVNLK